MNTYKHHRFPPEIHSKHQWQSSINSNQWSIELAFIEHPKNSHAASINKLLGKGGVARGKETPITLDAPDVLDVTVGAARPCGGYTSDGFVECVGLEKSVFGDFPNN
jgi:hypothetical protein